MQLHVLSDLHLEFATFVPPKLDVEVVILAGDIHVGLKAIPWAKEHFEKSTVVYVLGNHEYYRQAMPRHLRKVKELARMSNVRVLENESLVLGDVVFLGCTLWTDFELFGNPKVAGYHATQNMTDYRKIRVDPAYRKLRSIDTAGIHYRSRAWLAEQLEQNRGAKIVVITHHAPSKRSLPPRFNDDLLSAAYASHLDQFVERSEARLWIHGHVHESQDYLIGTTRVLCNPRGYPDDFNTGFTPDLLVSV
jgi:Icc-related predicted phosphoesterase